MTNSGGLGGSSIVYTYSGNNELLAMTNGSSTTNLNYNSGSEMTSLSSPAGSTTFSYDPEGDRTSTTPPTGTATDYTYDQAGRLTGVSGPTTASYFYNGDGLRMSKTVNGTTEQYTWNEASSLPLLLEDGSTDFIYGPGGLTLEQVSGSTPDYFLHDWQGSTMGLTSETGSLAASYTYDAYGNVTSSSGTASTRLLFQGQYQDQETGLYYLQSRYYDPSTGQFLSRDPDNTLVPYAYAVGDPINACDPTGEMLAHAPGSTGPVAVAPPPVQVSQQAVYYHALAKETTPTSAPQAQSAPAPAPSVSSGLGDQGAVNALHTAAVVTADGALGADTVSLAAYGLALAPTPAAPVLATVGTGALITGVSLNVLSCAANGALDYIGHGSILFTASTCLGIIPGAIGGVLSYAFKAESLGTQAAVGVATGVHGVISDGINFTMNNVL